MAMSKQGCVAAVGLLMVSMATDSTRVTAGKDKAASDAPQEWKVFATVTGGRPMKLEIPLKKGAYRTRAELARAVDKDEVKAAQWAAEVLKVDKIDWEKQMLICIDGDFFRGSYYVVNPIALTSDGKVLTVRYEVLRKVKKDGVADANYSFEPRGLLLVERFAGEVKFDKARTLRDAPTK